MAAVTLMTPGGDYVDDDGFFTCAVSVQHKVASKLAAGKCRNCQRTKIIKYFLNNLMMNEF